MRAMMWDGVGSSWIYRKSKCHSLRTRPEGALSLRGRALNELTRLEDISEYAKMRVNLVVVELQTDNRQRSFCASLCT